MAKVFLDHLIDIDEVITVIDSHHLDPEDRQELVDLVDEILHHHILNVILNHLPPKHHQDFIARLHADPASPDHLAFLKTRITIDIESEIITHAQRIKSDLLKEIAKSSSRG